MTVSYAKFGGRNLTTEYDRTIINNDCSSVSKIGAQKDVCCFAFMFPYQENFSNFNISTRQNWTSPMETFQEKESNDPFHVTVKVTP